MAWPTRGARYVDGRSKHPLYNVWKEMVRRCTVETHPAWEHYGGRGIKVCDEWVDNPWAFFEHMGERPDGMEVDRIDNDGNYEPGNVRWATRSEQLLNRRQRVHCPAGHDYAEHGKVYANGKRVCVICAENSRKQYQLRHIAGNR